VTEFYRHCNKPSGYLKGGAISSAAERTSSSEEGFGSAEFMIITRL